MSKFICQSCPERCSLFCAQNASEIPTRCQFVGKANWERVVEDKPPVYYTLPAPTAETEIDYKKAFDLILEHYGHGGSKFSCKLCKALGIHCLSSGECNDKIIEAIKRKCTKGGE